jgi:hypothetical protein
MRSASPEQLVVLAIFLLLPLLNFLLTLWRRRRDSRASSLEPAPSPPTPMAARATRPLETRQVPGSDERPRRKASTALVETPAAPRPLRTRARLGPRDARRAVVLMTILGPCRALEPGHLVESRPPGAVSSPPAP